MRLRELTIVAATALAVLGAAACGAQRDSASTVVPPPVSGADLAKVTLKVGDQKGGDRALLTSAGQLDNLPYKIEWSTFTSGPPEVEAASAGAIDVGTVGNTPPIFAAAAKAKVAAVSVWQGNVESDALLVPQDSTVRTVNELRGKTIAVAKGSSAHGQVLLNLRKAGLSTQDVKLVYLQPADAYAAFNQHQFDAWAVWDPYTSQALLESGARVLANGVGTANGYAFAVAGRAALADAGKNTAIRDLLVRLTKAHKWSDTHRSEWAQTWSGETGLKPDVALTAANRGGKLSVPLDDQVVHSEQDLADAFSTEHVLPGKVDFGAFVDRRFAADLEAARTANP